MKRDLTPQRMMRYGEWILAGLLALGAFIGAINDALSFVTWPVTIWGTLILVGGWFAIQAYLQRHPQAWSYGDNQVRITRLNIGHALPLLGMILLLWVPRLPVFAPESEHPIVITYTPTPNASLISQTAVLTDTAVALAFPAAQPGENLIIIAPFDGDGSVHPELWIKKSLEDEISTSKLSNIRIQQFPSAITEASSNSVLPSMQNTYRPTVIIWGWYDAVGINVHYKYVDILQTFGGPIPETYRPSLSESLRLSSQPDSFTLYIAKELPQEVAHISFLTIALIYTQRLEYTSAQSFIERAIATASGKFKSAENEAYLTLMLGWNHILAKDDFNYGIQSATKIINKNISNVEINIYAHELRAFSNELTSLQQYVKEHNITINTQLDLKLKAIVIYADKDIPPQAFKSQQALEDRTFIVNHIAEYPAAYLSYSVLAFQNYSFGHIREAINNMQRFLEHYDLPGNEVYNADQNYIRIWSQILEDRS